MNFFFWWKDPFLAHEINWKYVSFYSGWCLLWSWPMSQSYNIITLRKFNQVQSDEDLACSMENEFRFLLSFAFCYQIWFGPTWITLRYVDIETFQFLKLSQITLLQFDKTVWTKSLSHDYQWRKWSLPIRFGHEN